MSVVLSNYWFVIYILKCRYFYKCLIIIIVLMEGKMPRVSDDDLARVLKGPDACCVGSEDPLVAAGRSCKVRVYRPSRGARSSPEAYAGPLLNTD